MDERENKKGMKERESSWTALYVGLLKKEYGLLVVIYT